MISSERFLWQSHYLRVFATHVYSLFGPDIVRVKNGLLIIIPKSIKMTASRVWHQLAAFSAITYQYFNIYLKKNLFFQMKNMAHYLPLHLSAGRKLLWQLFGFGPCVVFNIWTLSVVQHFNWFYDWKGWWGRDTFCGGFGRGLRPSLFNLEIKMHGAKVSLCTISNTSQLEILKVKSLFVCLKGITVMI